MKELNIYILLFFIYAILGYIAEVIYVYIGSKKLVNRGFLNGPYIPIYGAGGVLITFLLTTYYNDPVIIFVMGLLICTALEYFVSYLLEKIFHNRWWDYSYRKYNINGRVCLRNSLLFGVCALFIIYIVNPVSLYFLSGVRLERLYLANGILLIIITIDLIISIFEAIRVNNISSHLDTILNEYTKNKNIKLNRIKTRLFDAFPNLTKNERLVKRLKALKKDFMKRRKLHK